MPSERVYPLDPETLELFALKGTQGGCGTVQIGNANGVKVRRVMQITSDFAKIPFWPAPGSEDTELGVLMEPEVGHGETEVYPRVQA